MFCLIPTFIRIRVFLVLLPSDVVVIGSNIARITEVFLYIAGTMIV